MSAFLSDLIARRTAGVWTLEAPLKYQSDRLGFLVTVPADFRTDLASVPRLPLAFLLAGDTAHEAAVVHDYLYQAHTALGVARDDADYVFWEAMNVSRPPEPAWRRWLMWSQVRLWGWSAWETAMSRRQYLNPGPHARSFWQGLSR